MKRFVVLIMILLSFALIIVFWGCGESITIEPKTASESSSKLRANALQSASCSGNKGVTFVSGTRWDHQIEYSIWWVCEIGCTYGGLSLSQVEDAVESAANKWNEDLGLEIFVKVISNEDIPIKLGAGSEPHVETSTGQFGKFSLSVELPDDSNYSYDQGFKEVVFHELGHVLGLRHHVFWVNPNYDKCKTNLDQNSTMSSNRPFGATQGDINTLLCSSCLDYASLNLPTYSPPPPDTPTGFDVSPRFHNNENQDVTISWNTSSGATDYRIYRQLQGESGYSLIKVINSGSTTSWIDTNVPWDSINMTIVYYKMRACSSAGCSGFTNAQSSAMP